MKKFTRLLALLLALALCLSFVACGDEEEEPDEAQTRYTITEEEWEAFQKGYDNVTIETKMCYSDEFNSSYVIKYTDGYICWCDNVWDNWDDEDGDSTTESAVGTRTSVGVQGGTVDSRPSTGSSYQNGTDDIRPSTSSGGYTQRVDYAQASNMLIFSQITEPVFSMQVAVTDIVTLPSVDLPEVGVSGGGWLGTDLWQLIYQLGSYKDSDGNTYKFNSLSGKDIGTGCVKSYNGKDYYELMVEDEDGDRVSKWAERVTASGTSYENELVKVDFKDLKYDSKERAYVYEMKDEKMGISVKAYFYFENEKVAKVLSFQSIANTSEEDEELFDVSVLTPNSKIISDDYVTSIQTYKNHGITKVKSHSFSTDDIITKVKK